MLVVSVLDVNAIDVDLPVVQAPGARNLSRSEHTIDAVDVANAVTVEVGGAVVVVIVAPLDIVVLVVNVLVVNVLDVSALDVNLPVVQVAAASQAGSASAAAP